MKELLKKFTKLSEINQVVGTYEIFVNGMDQPLKVKILKHMASGTYLGVANLEVKGKNQDGYSRALHTKDTLEEALEEAIKGFFQNYGEEAKIREVKGW